MCIPPIKNGKPCDGESILTRRCNVHPCQSVGVMKPPRNDTKNNNTETELKTVIKVLPFSDRPQKYSVFFFIKKRNAL
jgi:hypothetical protein